MHRRGRIQAALGVALIAVTGAGFVGSAAWAGTPLGGSASALPLDAAVGQVAADAVQPTLFSRPVGTRTPSPTPSMGDMMKSMQEMMNRCSQMMAAGGMGGTNGMQPAG